MRAMVLSAQRPIAERPLIARRLPVPDPGRGEVLLAVTACAICRTDLHIAEGDLPLLRSPLVLGHQIVGRVLRSGQDAGRLQPGTRVGVAWLRRTCGACAYCTSGRENLCAKAEFTGYHADGGYAEYAVVPAAFAVKIPDTAQPPKIWLSVLPIFPPISLPVPKGRSARKFPLNWCLRSNVEGP